MLDHMPMLLHRYGLRPDEQWDLTGRQLERLLTYDG